MTTRAQVSKIIAQGVAPGVYGPFNIHCILHVAADGSVEIEMDERIPGTLVMRVQEHKNYGGKAGIVLNYEEPKDGKVAN